MVRWGIAAWVPGAVPLAVALFAFAIAPGFTVFNVWHAVSLALVSATLVLLLRALLARSGAHARSSSRARVAVILGIAWTLAYLLSPLLTLLSGSIWLGAITSAFQGITTSATRVPELHLYPSLLLSTAPLAALGLLSAMAILPVTMRTPRPE